MTDSPNKKAGEVINSARCKICYKRDAVEFVGVCSKCFHSLTGNRLPPQVDDLPEPE